MSLHLKLLDIDHPLTFEESKLRQIEAHDLIYLSINLTFVAPCGDFNGYSLTHLWILSLQQRLLSTFRRLDPPGISIIDER